MILLFLETTYARIESILNSADHLVRKSLNTTIHNEDLWLISFPKTIPLNACGGTVILERFQYS